MASCILYKDEIALMINNEIYASNRIAYQAWVNRIADNFKDHSNGKLQERSVKTVSYDLVQKSSQGDNIGSIVKAMTTEFSTVNISPKHSEYNKTVWAVRVPESELGEADTTNAKAKLMNEMKQLWDGYGYHGGGINVGVSENDSHIVTDELSMVSGSDLNAAITAAFEIMKLALGLSDDDKKYVTVGYTNGISPIFTMYPDGVTKTARELILGAHVGVDLGQIPARISGDDEFIELYYRPAIEVDHGAIPSLYAVRELDEFSKVSTFVFETPKVSFSESGAIVRVPRKALAKSA
jgi:hypothetical protein